MTTAKRAVFQSLVFIAGLAGAVLTSEAQQGPQPWGATEPQRAAPPGQPKGQPKSTSKPTSAPPPKAVPKEDGNGRASDGALRQRLEQLEEQIADMQVMIGTLESIGKGSMATAGAGPGRSGGGSATDQARLDSLETQIRALSSQVEQLANQLRQNARRGDAGSFGEQPAAPKPEFADVRSGRPLFEPQRGVPSFGATTVTPDTHVAATARDPIGRMIEPEQPGPPAGGAQLPAATGAGNPKELYETAYGYLLQQDYGAAEVAFEEFLRRYPNDRQTADAQYWYGETLYVQRRYKPAAQAFLKVIERHQTSSKVPNSLLKVAMALEQLGQKDCGIFNELDARHPNAPADVKSKARAVKQRMGC